MAKVYDYKCNGCGTHWEEDTPDAYAKNARHLKKGKVCGNIFRDWSSVGVNTTNLRAARG